MNEEQLLENEDKILENEEIIYFIQKFFNRLYKNSAQNLLRILILQPNREKIEINNFYKKYRNFLKRNSGKFDKVINKDNEIKYYIKKELLDIIKKDFYVLLEKMLDSIDYSDDAEDYDDNEDENEQKIKTQKYRVSDKITFQEIREKVDEEGPYISFKVKTDIPCSKFVNKKTLQRIKIHINDSGQFFNFPIKYFYYCNKCKKISYEYEYKVASTKTKIYCKNELKTEKDGKIKLKKCNQMLYPDENRTQTMDAYIYNVSFWDSDNVQQNGEAISFKKLPKGELDVTLVKIPRNYSRHFFFIVDYKELEKETFDLPTKKSEHYIFDLINAIDKYIKKNTGYQHYGYLPMKMAMLIQFFGRYNNFEKNNFNISLSGTMSSGKSQFARYWGLTLYSEDSWGSNATSISIPKLRGTMEVFRLFNKECRYQYKGLLGEKDLIIIDEIKEAPEVKNNLKQYLLEPTYEYSKQGGTNQIFNRTAQIVVTQNINTKHLNKYCEDVENFYETETLFVNSKNQEKPLFNEKRDLTLPIESYNDNLFLKEAIIKVRNKYERNNINWIDGSEMALKQRFFFYFFIGTNKKNEELDSVIRQNSINKIIDNNMEIIRLMDVKKLKEKIEKFSYLYYSKTDIDFFKEIDKLLLKYGKINDARTKEMAYNVGKIIRIIDDRVNYKKIDLRILEYLLKSIDNKIEVVDTNDFYFFLNSTNLQLNEKESIKNKELEYKKYSSNEFNKEVGIE